MANKKLPIVLKDIDATTYKKPERKNELIDDEVYDKIDENIIKGVKIATNGVVYIEEDKVDKLLGENKSDSQYIVDNKIDKKYKRNIGGTDLIHSSALVGLLDERSQELRSTSKQTKQQYSRDSLTNISDSDQAQAIRRNLDDYTTKEQKKLRKSRESEIDEITGEELEKGYAFHHKNQKSLHTDPEKAVDSDEGILVNDSTHKDIHLKKIRDEKALEEYKKEVNKDNDDF
jgi:hypothetical protein